MDRTLEQIDYEALRAAASRARLEAAEDGRARPRKIRRRPRDVEKISLLRMICEDYRRRWPPLWWQDETGQWCVRMPRLESFLEESWSRRVQGDGICYTNPPLSHSIG
jgi:hypothetical protein